MSNRKVSFISQVCAEDISTRFQGAFVIDLTRSITHPQVIDPDKEIASSRDLFITQIMQYLEDLTVGNPGLDWLAHTAAAKNPLSSQLINTMLDTLVCIKLVQSNAHTDTVILGATAAQEFTICNAVYGDAVQSSSYRQRTFLRRCRKLARGALFLTHLWKAFHDKKPGDKRTSDIGILTYIDGSNRKGKDPYFGNLADELTRKEPHLVVRYLFVIYPPYLSRFNNELSETERKDAVIHYALLSFPDYVWIMRKLIGTLFFAKYTIFPDTVNPASLHEVVKEILLEEMPVGYVDSLIMYRVGCRLSRDKVFRKIIYPFENKSLEKCLLSGIGKNIVTVGYQHTSITPRHFSFLMRRDELAVTPVPDQIITTGRIPYEWLTQKGNFPAEIIKIGCSFRHAHLLEECSHHFEWQTARLFLAVSSSYTELRDGVLFLKGLHERNPGFQLRIRTHVNFPLSILPDNLLRWTLDHVEVRQELPLYDNFSWADITLYVSSTVAMESLMAGIPVIKLDIDKLDSDPLLMPDVSYRWNAGTADECIDAVKQIAALPSEANSQLALQARAYVNDYFIPKREGSYTIFLN